MVQSINDRGPFKIKHVYKTVAEEKDGVKKEKKVFDGYSLAIGDTRGYSAYQNGGVLTQVCCRRATTAPVEGGGGQMCDRVLAMGLLVVLVAGEEARELLLPHAGREPPPGMTRPGTGRQLCRSKSLTTTLVCAACSPCPPASTACSSRMAPSSAGPSSCTWPCRCAATSGREGGGLWGWLG